MAQAARLNLRMQKELKLLLTDPPPGASFPFLSADSNLASLSTIDAQIEGQEGTVYAKGIFSIKIQIPERYPFQPPCVTFATPIYHPNIDNGGRICLDILNLPPKGAWQPSLNISTVLTSIRLLLSEPNPDDGLMCEVSKEYKYNRQAFEQKARAMTEKYARTGADGHNFRIQCNQTNSDLSTTVEVKHSDKESRHGDYNFGFSHSKPCGIGRKLSLEPSSSSSTHKRNTDGEANGMPEALHFDLEKMEAKRNVRESRDTPDKNSLRNENLHGNEMGLSLESSVQFHKGDGCDVKDKDQKHTHSFCNASSESSLLQGGKSHDLQLHPHHDGKSTYDSKIMSSNRLSHVSQKTPWGPSDACQTTNDGNEKLLVTPAIPSSQSNPNSSGASTMFSTVNHNVLQNCQDSVAKLEKKVCSVSKKLSLGLKGSSRRLEKDRKESNLLVHKLPFSTPRTQRKVGNGSKLSLGPLTKLQGSNEDMNQLHSGEPPIDESKKQQSDQYQNRKVDGEITQCSEESKVAESIIVLDSEDSEEESNGSVRCKQSLLRKRIGKRKTQA